MTDDRGGSENKKATRSNRVASKTGARASLFLRRLGLDVGEALVDFVHLGDEVLFDLLAIGAVHDAEAGGVLDDAGG